MSHKNKKSLCQQMTEVLQSKLKIGESKHKHKIAGDAGEYIFSWSTYRSYSRCLYYFLTYVKDTYKCKTLSQARLYADEWLQLRINQGKSAYTVKLELAALCKLYGETAADYIPTPPRLRKNITRSRNKVARDAHFSEAKHADFVEFCKSTGLRRAELKALTGDKLVQDANGRYCILVNKMSKGGRTRMAPIVGNVSKIVAMMQKAGNGKVFERIPNAADVHSYRGDYATTVYKMHARPISKIPRVERYCCRKDRKGVHFDRNAMLEASRALGHNRVCVVGEHYLKI